MGGCCRGETEHTVLNKRPLPPKPFALISPDRRLTLTIGTYNVSNCTQHQNWSRRVHQIAKEIDLSGCDIVGLQELRFDPRKEKLNEPPFSGDFEDAEQNLKQPHMFLDLLQLLPDYSYYKWQPVMEYRTGEVEGIAIISKFEIIESDYTKIRMTSFRDNNLRGLQRVWVDIQGTTIQVYNTHITVDIHIQANQIQEIMNKIDMNEFDGTQVLLGCFNFKSEEHAPIIENDNDFRFLDTAKCLGYAMETYNSHDPHFRFDRVYVTGPAINIIKSTTTGFSTSEEDSASSHCMTYTVFNTNKAN